MNKTQDKLLMILEKSSYDLKQSNEDKYILEGVFTEFGIKNNNDRIYEEADFLPHLEELQKKISKRPLPGELDHPEKFETSLQKISHVIESLEYLPEKRQVIGKIRLLNTPCGKIARQLVDDGFPLSISSRAAGVVSENKKVQMKKIFTYDLVVDPGFSGAQLSRINESLGFMQNENVSFYDVTDTEKNYLYTLLSENDADKKTDIKMSTNNDEVSYISSKQFEDFRYELNNKLRNLDTKVSTVNESNSSAFKSTNEYKTLVKAVKKIDSYLPLLAEKVEKNIRYANNIVNTVNGIIDDISESKVMNESYNGGSNPKYDMKIAKLEKASRLLQKHANIMADKINISIIHSNHISEMVDNNITYTEDAVRNVGITVNEIKSLKKYGDHLTESINYTLEEIEKTRDYSEYVAKNLSKSNNSLNITSNKQKIMEKHNDSIIKRVNELHDHANYIGNKLNDSIHHANYLGEKLNVTIHHTDHLAEHLENTIDYSENQADKINTLIESNVFIKPVVGKVSEKDRENRTTGEIVTIRINEALETLKVRKEESMKNEKKYSFFKYLSESKQREFLALDESKKQEVLNAISTNAYYSEVDVVRIWESTLLEKEKSNTLWLQRMPEGYKKLWESMTVEQKNSTAARARNYVLKEDHQIKSFWNSILQSSRDTFIPLNESKSVETINESTDGNSVQKDIAQRGYSNEYLDTIRNSLRNRINPHGK